MERNLRDTTLGGNDAFLDELFVAPEHRGRGIAQRPIDVLAANTPKDFVLQLDVGTCLEMKQDPVAFINQTQTSKEEKQLMCGGNAARLLNLH